MSGTTGTCEPSASQKVPAAGVDDALIAGSLPKPAVSIMIVAYNSAALIGSCLAAIPQACERWSYEILLVDNGDGSTETLVRETFPQVRIIPSRGNVGFAAGNNLLARAARADLLLLVNPDMILHSRSIDALVDARRAYPDAAAWGGVSLNKAGQPDNGNSITVPTLREFFTGALGRSVLVRATDEELSHDRKVDVLMGGFVMFSRSAWDEVGGLDESYFLYCEEVDLFYRLASRGHSFWRIAGARGIHDSGHGDGFSPRRNLYRVAGIMEFARHHWSPARTACAAALIWIGAVERLIAGAVVGRWRPRLKLIGKAHVHVARRPGLWIHGYDPKRGLLARLEQSGEAMPS